MALVEVRNLTKSYDVAGGEAVRAVNDVSFDIEAGETLGLVGESGCGKSTLGRCVTRLIEPSSGSVLFDGVDLSSISGGELRKRRRQFQTIFQDPYASLNPRMRVGDIISEGLMIYGLARGDARREAALAMMRRVGLRDDQIDLYPHEFSGGQRQRIAIARALILNPSFIVADEPVSALDVSIQAQILDLLQDLRSQIKLTFLFISHDLRVVRYLSDRVAVMYLGQIVEIGPAETVYNEPRHPYTRALLASVPRMSGGRRDRAPLAGDIPSPVHLPSGCAFHPRCPFAEPICREIAPSLAQTEFGVSVSCHVFGRSSEAKTDVGTPMMGKASPN